MARRVLESKLRTWRRVVGLGLCVGGACSAMAAPALGQKERDALLRQHEAWVERAVVLGEVAAEGGAPLREQRARCWGIGTELPDTLTQDIAKNQEALAVCVTQLRQVLEGNAASPAGACASAASGAPAPSSKEEVSIAQQRAELLQALEMLERQQLILESEVLQPRNPTSALVAEVIRDRERRKLCVQWMEGWNDRLASVAKHPGKTASLTAQVDERIRWSFLDRAADGEVFNSNNSGLPSVMTDEAGVTERLGGPDTLAASLAWGLASTEEDSWLQGIITFNPNFPLREEPPPGSRDEINLWLPILRLQVPLTTTPSDAPPPAAGEPAGRLRRYALTLGYDFRDFRDPRYWKRLECMGAVEALVPWLGPPLQGSVSSVAARRRSFYASCVEEGADALRMGIRGSAQLLTVEAPGGDAVRAGPAALGFIVEPNRYLAGQLTWRRVFWPRAHHEYVLSAHLGTGLPRPVFGTDSLVRLGLDGSLSFSDRRHEEHGAQWFVAPSLLVRVTRYLFVTVSTGYLRGFSESGMRTNLGLTLDADPALTYRVPPPSP